MGNKANVMTISRETKLEGSQLIFYHRCQGSMSSKNAFNGAQNALQD